MRHTAYAFFLSLAATVLISGTGHAQSRLTDVTPTNNTAASQNKAPIEITADKTLEWLRNEKRFIARENAKAVQGDVSIASDLLQADYQETEKSAMDIQYMEAIGNVVLNSKMNNAYGDHAVYNVAEGKAVMTGENLLMRGPDQEVTARDRFEYWTVEGKLVAIGNAKVKRKKPTGQYDTLQASKIIAILEENAKGERVLKSLEAIENVVITTPTEIVTGTHGIYRAATNKAELSGNVRITRGPNVLEGNRAEIDLNTNTSRMFGAPNGGGQVRGVFYPDSENMEK